MTAIKFSKEEIDQILPLIQRYLSEEMDVEVGSFDAEFLLDFFCKEIGPFIYNRALLDARALLSKQLDTISESIYELEKPLSLEITNKIRRSS